MKINTQYCQISKLTLVIYGKFIVLLNYLILIVLPFSPFFVLRRTIFYRFTAVIIAIKKPFSFQILITKEVVLEAHINQKFKKSASNRFFENKINYKFSLWKVIEVIITNCSYNFITSGTGAKRKSEPPKIPNWI